MNDRVLRVLVAPRESEKAVMIGEQHNQYVFRVTPDATSREVRLAVEKLFPSVKVKRVNILNIKGKVRQRLRGNVSRKPNWKKAYVSLQPGSSIDFAS